MRLVTDEDSSATVRRLLKVDLPVEMPRQGDGLLVFASKLIRKHGRRLPLPPRAKLTIVVEHGADKVVVKVVRAIAAMVPSAVAMDVAAAKRMAQAAQVPGSAPHLIAKAELQDNATTLAVTTCDLDTLRVPVAKLRSLRSLTPRQLARFEVEGGGLRWPAHDIDIGLDGLRQAIDVKARVAAKAKTQAHSAKYGAAIRAEREAAGLDQESIPGVSARTLHRIEHGKQDHVRIATLDKLAKAHGVSTAVYLDRLAKRMGKG